jgi:dTDP-4-dehydrorhamnose 3,5-epimerase-like enzyme
LAPTTHSSETTQDSWLEGNVRLIQIPRFDDSRGGLVPFEFDQLPFVPRRMFVVQDVPVQTVRGRHSHAKQRQIMICLAGRIEVDVRSGQHHASITIDHSQTGLLVEPGVWNSQKFVVDGSILLVLASGAYGPADYTTDDADSGG